MKKIKKLLSILIILAVLAAGLPAAAFATGEDTSFITGTYWYIRYYTGVNGRILFESDGTYTLQFSTPNPDGSTSETGQWSYKDGVLTINGMDFYESDDKTGFSMTVAGGAYSSYLYDTGEPTPETVSSTIKIYLDSARTNAVTWTDAEPFVDSNNRTMVPLRAVADAMGLSVEWDNDTQTASFSGTTYMEGNGKTSGSLCEVTVRFVIGSKTETVIYRAHLNNKTLSTVKTVKMDTTPVIVNSRTYAPVRYLAESFGYSVSWDSSTNSITMVSGSLNYLFN